MFDFIEEDEYQYLNIDTVGMLKITAEEFVGQSVAVLGIKGSGKSNSAAVLMEEMLENGVPVCVVDIAGEYYTLKERYEHVTLVGRSLFVEVDIELTATNCVTMATKAYQHGLSVVMDLSGMSGDKRESLLIDYFTTIWNLAAYQRIPCVIFLEEAHNWVPQSTKAPAAKLFIDIATEGRKRGLSLVLIGQRSPRINKDVLTQADIALLHRVRHPADIAVYMAMIPRKPRWVRERVNILKVGDALVLIGEKVLRCTMRKRRTRHVGFTPTLQHIPEQNTQLSLLDMMRR